MLRRKRTSEETTQKPKLRKRAFKRLRRLMTVAGMGALAAYFFDPDRGKARRNVTKDRLGGAVRGAKRRGEQVRRRFEAERYGVEQKIAHPPQTQSPPENDETLAHKVESEVLGKAGIPKGSINVNAEYGVVVLRGVAETPDQIRRIEDQVRKIPGVVDVDNLLHLPKTPAPATAGRKR